MQIKTTKITIRRTEGPMALQRPIEFVGTDMAKPTNAPDPAVAAIAKTLTVFHPLARDAERLGAADPVLAASELVVMLCRHSSGWTDAVILASPSKAIQHAVNVDRFRATLDELDQESEEP